MTHLVGKQTKALLNGLGYKTATEPHCCEASIMVFVNGTKVPCQNNRRV